MVRKSTYEARCIICQKNNTEKLFENSDRLHHIKGVFKLYRCKMCGLVFLSPIPKNISKFYPEEYAPYNMAKSNLFEKLFCSVVSSARYYKKDKNVFDKFASKIYEKIYNPVLNTYTGRVLDIGCGDGETLNRLRKYGYYTYGIDFSKKAVDFAVKQYRLRNLKVGNFEKSNYPNNFFDVIILNHVIEHLSDPRKTIKKINMILKPGGLLLITTPNKTSFNAIVFRQYWFHLDSPRHLCLYDKNLISSLLKQSGNFKVKKINYCPTSYSLLKSWEYYKNKQFPLYLGLFLNKALLPFSILLSIFHQADVFSWYIEKEK